MKAKLIAAAGLITMACAAFALLDRPTQAPDVRFTTLAGETFSISELRGKVVLLNFWATYCATCVKEMPKLVAMQRKFAPLGYETIAVAVKQDDPARIAEFAARGALPFRTALDRSGEAAREFGSVRVTPTTFLIDRQGRVLRRYVGEPDWAELYRLVEQSL